MVGRTGSGCSGRLRRLARRDVDSACGQLAAEPDAPSRRDGDPEACRYQNTRNTYLRTVVTLAGDRTMRMPLTRETEARLRRSAKPCRLGARRLSY
jgi:hypothetical protein